MKKSKINIVYHNPNTDEETAKYITDIFIEASRIKFESMLECCATKQILDEEVN